MYFFIFILFRIDIPVSKQWRPWSDSAFCGVRSGSSVFAYVPKNGTLGLYWLNQILKRLCGLRRAHVLFCRVCLFLSLFSFHTNLGSQNRAEDRIFTTAASVATLINTWTRWDNGHLVWEQGTCRNGLQFYRIDSMSDSGCLVPVLVSDWFRVNKSSERWPNRKLCS